MENVIYQFRKILVQFVEMLYKELMPLSVLVNMDFLITVPLYVNLVNSLVKVVHPEIYVVPV